VLDVASVGSMFRRASRRGETWGVLVRSYICKTGGNWNGFTCISPVKHWTSRTFDNQHASVCFWNFVFRVSCCLIHPVLGETIAGLRKGNDTSFSEFGEIRNYMPKFV
jgi:hypothetical protein